MLSDSLALTGPSQHQYLQHGISSAKEAADSVEAPRVTRRNAVAELNA